MVLASLVILSTLEEQFTARIEECGKKKKNIVESGNWLTIGAQKHLLSWIERNEDRFCHALLHPNNFWG